MSAAKTLMWVTGTLEAFLGIPFMGGLMVVSFLYLPLMVMMILHIITLVYCNQEKWDTAPSTLGIITCCIAWIPFIGMIMHLLAATFLLVSAAKEHDKVRV
jgi:predicted branched-subunit amino acid permease